MKSLWSFNDFLFLFVMRPSFLLMRGDGRFIKSYFLLNRFGSLFHFIIKILISSQSISILIGLNLRLIDMQ